MRNFKVFLNLLVLYDRFLCVEIGIRDPELSISSKGFCSQSVNFNALKQFSQIQSVKLFNKPYSWTLETPQINDEEPSSSQFHTILFGGGFEKSIKPNQTFLETEYSFKSEFEDFNYQNFQDFRNSIIVCVCDFFIKIFVFFIATTTR